ncbi:hypothetical protein [Enterococcus faecium]|uniref:hypothetical protein n=1 Tax=Enterococcus faecium TaxID=1352 RepID=UPI00295ECAE3|nr:hypothetical protein [Enterococcus faecium]
MRVQSYGNSVFDVKREFQDSRRKTKKLIAYFILSAIVFYIVKFVLELNSMVFTDMVHKMLNGEPINFNFDYMLEKAQSNQVVAFLVSTYYFIEKSIFSLKDFFMGLFTKLTTFYNKILKN